MTVSDIILKNKHCHHKNFIKIEIAIQKIQKDRCQVFYQFF